VKPVKETEAIKIYVQKDENVKSGVMWKIEPPFSCRGECKKEYSMETTWAKNAEELTDVVNKMTGWKLSKR